MICIPTPIALHNTWTPLWWAVGSRAQEQMVWSCHHPCMVDMDTVCLSTSKDKTVGLINTRNSDDENRLHSQPGQPTSSLIFTMPGYSLPGHMVENICDYLLSIAVSLCRCKVIHVSFAHAIPRTCTLLRKGPFKCYVTLFSLKSDPHPPTRNANNVEHLHNFFPENLPTPICVT